MIGLVIIYHTLVFLISPIESQTLAIMALEAPKILIKFRWFLVWLHFISKFIPNFAQISHSLRPLLKKSSEFSRPEVHKNFHSEIKNRIANAT